MGAYGARRVSTIGALLRLARISNLPTIWSNVLAASVLASGTDGYPAAGWNVAVYEFRNAACALPGAGRPYTVSRHPACESCNARLSG